MPNNVFVLQRSTLDPNANTTSDRLYRVATPKDLETLPVGAPTSESNRLFLSSVLSQTWAASGSLDAVGVADLAWAGLQADVKRLVDALDAADRMSSAEPVWIGTPPP